MTSIARQARMLEAAISATLPPIAPPVDVTDAQAFPEIAKAREWYANLAQEVRDELDRDWQ